MVAAESGMLRSRVDSKSDLTTGLQRYTRHYSPHRFPHRFQASFRLDSVLCVCDVSTFGELEGDAAGGREVAQLLREQLAISDVCLLNKCEPLASQWRVEVP